jgi:serine/threonine-protein kinase
MNSGATYTTLTYGTKYSALGWTVMPTADGTTFTYDATGHGIFVSTSGFDPF